MLLLAEYRPVQRCLRSVLHVPRHYTLCSVTQIESEWFGLLRLTRNTQGPMSSMISRPILYGHGYSQSGSAYKQCCNAYLQSGSAYKQCCNAYSQSGSAHKQCCNAYLQSGSAHKQCENGLFAEHSQNFNLFQK